LLARGWVFASAYVVSAILARKLGAADYGIYGVVMSQLLWLEMLATGGVPAAIARLMADARHDPGGVERSARALLLGLSGVLLAVGWFLAPHWASLMRIPNGELLFRIAIIDLPFAAVYASYDGMLYGRRRFGVVAVAQAVLSAIKVAGIVALIGLGFSVERALVVSVLSMFVVCALLALRYRLREFRPSADIVKAVAAMAAPMALYLVASQVLVNLDLWSLKSLWEGEGEVVGQYVASVNLARTLTVIPATQAGVLFTSVAWAVASRSAARARQHIHEATRFAVLLAAAGCVILSLNGSDVLSTLFSGAYAGGQRFLPLQLAGFGLFALLDVFCISLMGAGRQWLVAGVMVALVPLVWLTNYVFIPRFGPMGAASSMLLGMGIAAALTGALAYRHFGSLVRASTLGRVLAAAALVGLASATIPLRGPLVIVKLALLGGLYVLVLWVLGEIAGRDFGLPGRNPVDRSA
jgi:O-antigen/teichoic acid export membrane protein